MKKFLLKAFAIILCLDLMLFFSSCQQSNKDEFKDIDLEEEYIQAFEKGKHQVLWDMYNASNLDNTAFLYSGDVWETEYFSLVFSDVTVEDEFHLKYDFTLKDVSINERDGLTIKDCFEAGLIFFNIYSSEDILMYNDDCYFYSALDNHGTEFLGGKNIQGQILLHKDHIILIILIIIDGCFYTAEYYPEII